MEKICSAIICKNLNFTASWFAQNVVFFTQNVVFFTQNVVFLRKMLSFWNFCPKKFYAARPFFQKYHPLHNAANRKNPIFSKNFFPKRQNWTFLKMSKNQIFKILFDKKTLNEIFHKKKPDTPDCIHTGYS